MFIYVNYAEKNHKLHVAMEREKKLATAKTAKMFTCKYHNDQNK